MIKNVIFDFGCVLVYWSQHNLYDTYFGSKEKTDWFVDNICTWEWNNQTDMGKSFAASVAEKISEFPEWEKEIRMYWDRWEDMLGGEVHGAAIADTQGQNFLIAGGPGQTGPVTLAEKGGEGFDGVNIRMVEGGHVGAVQTEGGGRVCTGEGNVEFAGKQIIGQVAGATLRTTVSLY